MTTHYIWAKGSKVYTHFPLFLSIFVSPTIVYAADRNNDGSTDWKFIVAVLALIWAIIWAIYNYKVNVVNRRKDKEEAYRHSVKRSFDIYSSSNIDDLGIKLFGGDPGYKISYVQRKAGEKLKRLEQRLLSGNILLTGRTGIGKTREAIETIKRLAKQEGEEITVLVPLSNMDTGFVLETAGLSRNGVLLIDNVHKAFSTSTSGNNSGDFDDRTFLERLSATLEQLKTREYFDNLHCIFTCRDEPGWQDKIKLRAQFWSDNAFHITQIPWIKDKSVGADFIRQVSEYFEFRITEQAIQKIASCWDGTCSAIITSFNILKLKGLVPGGVITEETINNFSFTYPDNWYDKIYQNHIKNIAEQKAVFDALALLYRIQIPSYRFLLVDIAATAVKGRLAWLWRKKIDKAITNLQAWMFDHRGEIICPYAYIDAIGSDSLASLNVVPAFKRAFRNKYRTEQLSPYLGNIVLSSRTGSLSPQTAIDLFKSACKYSNSAQHEYYLEQVLEISGDAKLALEAIQKSVEIDPDNIEAGILQGWLYSKMGNHRKALEISKNIAERSRSSRSLLNYGVILSKLRHYPDAITILKKARKLEPTDPKILYSLGITYDKAFTFSRATDRKLIREAVKNCIYAIRLDPYDSTAWQSLGIALEHLERKSPCIYSLERAHELNNSKIMSLSLARGYFRFGDNERGIRVLESLRLNHKAEADVIIEITRCYGFAELYNYAIQTAREGLRLELDDAGKLRLTRVLAINLCRHEDPEYQREAMDLWEGIVEDSEDAEDWRHLSVAYARNRLPDKAVSAARRALNLNPDGATRSKTVRSLAFNLMFLDGEEFKKEAVTLWEGIAEDSEEAEDWYQLSRAYASVSSYYKSALAALTAIQDNKAHSAALLQLSISVNQLRQNEMDQIRQQVVGSLSLTLESIIKELQSGPDNPDLWRLATWYFIDHSEIDRFISYALAALEKNNSLHAPIVSVAQELKTPHPNKALTIIDRIILIDSKEPSYFNLRGAIKRSIGDFSGAIDDYNDALMLDSENRSAWYGLGLTYADNNQLGKACTALSKASDYGHRKAKEYYRKLCSDSL